MKYIQPDGSISDIHSNKPVSNWYQIIGPDTVSWAKLKMVPGCRFNDTIRIYFYIHTDLISNNVSINMLQAIQNIQCNKVPKIA